MHRSLTAAFLALILSCAAQGQYRPYSGGGPLTPENQMFVWNGETLMPLFNADGIQCDHWLIWVFSDGTQPIPGTEWGAVDGASPEDAEQKWQQALELEHQLKED